MRLVFLFAVLSAVAACAFVGEQVGINAASSCIHKNCSDPEAADYTRCEAACRAQYH